MTGLTLDHVALVTADLAASKEDYEKLGFTLTRQSSHKGRITPDGPVVPWGSGNHCAMFQRGYYEILGLTDPKRYHEQFRAALNRFHGVSLIALGCESADAFHQSAPSVRRAPFEVGRDVPIGPAGETTREGLFRIVHVDEDAFPNLELLFIEHVTRDVLWQKALMQHPNGVTAFSGITICSDAPDDTAVSFERCTGLGGTARDGRPHFALDEGYVAIAPAADLGIRYPGAVLPAVPCVAVVELAVSDLERTKKLLAGNGITARATTDGVWVRPERTGGVILEFRE